MDPAVVMIPATPENFYEVGYLAANPDVAQAAAAGAIKTGKQHFESMGRKRSGCVAYRRAASTRRAENSSVVSSFAYGDLAPTTPFFRL
jgi:hypothetical protein